MRDSLKNKQKVYVAKYLGNNEIINDDGYGTGVYEKQYSEPQLLRVNITSPVSLTTASNSAEAGTVGILLKYDKVIVSSVRLDIQEQDLFWVGIDINKEANYRVGGVYPFLNTYIVGLEFNNIGAN